MKRLLGLDAGILGRAACPPGHLDHPLHHHAPQRVDVAPGGGFGLDTSRSLIVAPDSPLVLRN